MSQPFSDKTAGRALVAADSIDRRVATLGLLAIATVATILFRDQITHGLESVYRSAGEAWDKAAESWGKALGSEEHEKRRALRELLNGGGAGAAGEEAPESDGDDGGDKGSDK